jgi:membrane protease YdiL (CAAX protease family)
VSPVVVERVPPVRVGRDRIDVPVAVAVWLVSWFAGQLLFQIVALAFGESPGDAVTSIGALALGISATWSAYMVGLWWASTRAGSGNPIEDYAVAFDSRDLLAVPIGVLAQLVLIPVVYMPLRALWPDTFTQDRLEETARDLVERAGGTSMVMLVLVVVVGAPIVEELVYRGLLQQSFAARINDPLALVAASLWFAVIHFRPLEYPGLFVAGLVFGACFLVTGRLTTAIVAHAAFNLTGLLAVWP